MCGEHTTPAHGAVLGAQGYAAAGLYREQSRAGVKAAQEDARRTDLAVVRDVKRMYYGALLARELLRIGRDALARLEVTLELTESLYKSGSGRVKKTDYLQNKTIVESLRSILATTEGQERSARAALVNTMALPWDTEIELATQEIPNEPCVAELPKLVDGAYRFSPDWARLAAGLEAAAGKVQEAQGETRVKVGLTGSFHYLENSAGNGILGDPTHWAIGIGLSLPVFDGYLGRNKIREAQARLRQLMEQKELLRDGIALQVQYIFLTMSGAQASLTAAEAAQEAATANRELNERAYQDDLVDTEDVIQAQIMESLAESRRQMALHQQAAAQADLEFAVGSEIGALLEPAQ